MEQLSNLKEYAQEHSQWIRVATSLLGGCSVGAIAHSPEVFLVSTAIGLAVAGTTPGVKEKFLNYLLDSHVPSEEQQQKVSAVTKAFAKKIRARQDEDLPSLSDSNKHYFFIPDMLNNVEKDELLIAIDNDIWYTINLGNCYHILIAGQTGNGKTTLIRQLLMQMILKGCCCYLIDPMYKEVKGVSDDRKVECWEPLATRMSMNPSETNQTHKTRDELFQRIDLKMDARNKERGDARVERRWKPIFIFVDEGPNVIKNCPHAEEVIGRIVREGRQLKVFLVLVTQSAQVQSLGVGTDDLSQFCTRFYLGGDDRTRREIMNQLPKDAGQKLKKLQVAMTRVDDKTPAVIQLPYLNNEDLYASFGDEFCLDDFADWFEDLEDEDEDPLGQISISNDSKGASREVIETKNEQKIETLKFEMPDDEIGRIIQAFEDLEAEKKEATPNALWKKLGVNWNYQPKIEYVAGLAGYEIIYKQTGKKPKESKQ